MKKIISILMAAVMLIGCFSMMSFATVNDAVCKVEFKVKEIVDNVVTFEVWLEQTDLLGTLGAFDALYIGYDSRVFEDIDNLQDNVPLYWDTQTTVITEGYPCDNNYAKGTDSWITKNPSTVQPNATDLAKGWDTILFVSMIPDGTDDNYYTPAACLSFKLRLKADAPADACYEVGIADTSITGDIQTVLNEEIGGIGGANGADLEFPTTAIFELVNATVEKPAAGPVVAKKAAQVKFTADETQPLGVADAFKLRIKSVIKAKDWDDYFMNTTAEGATTNMITAVGMVAFPLSETALNEATATEAANKAINSANRQGEEGVYKAASTTYIQKESATSDAYFGAIIDTTHERCTEDIQYVGFVQYKDNAGDLQIIFYENVEVATVASNYATHVHNFEIKNWSQA